jgi:integrase
MHTVNEMFDKYEKERLPELSARTKIDYARHIKTLRREFGEGVASALTRQEISDFMKVSKGKILRNRMLAVLSAAYREALDWGWIQGNPCSLIERHVPQPKDRQLTEEEFQAARKLVAKAPRSGWRLALVMDLARYTGQLQGDIISLRWSQVNEEEGTILFRHRITRKKITVLVTPELRAVLDRAKQRSGKNQYVVTTRAGMPYTSDGIRAMWQRFMQRKWKATGNDPFTFHDIRRLACEAHRVKQVRETQDTVAAYPQFDAVVRAEATEMAKHYKVFYCLELSIRKLIISTMEKAYGPDWWNSGKVNQQIKQAVDDLMSKEIDSGMAQRSERELDYTTFGQLSQLIIQNWDVFDKVLKSRNAVGNIMASLNRIRGPIAHFSPMSDREVKRLELTVEDWFSILVPGV